MTERYDRYLHPYLNDRRGGQERRKFSYTMHLPERRTGEDRRSTPEHRKTHTQQMVTQPERGNKSTAIDESA